MLLYISTSTLYKEKFFLFTHTPEGCPVYLYVYHHETYCYIMTNRVESQWDKLCPPSTEAAKKKICPGTQPCDIPLGQDGEAQQIRAHLDEIGIDVINIKVKRMHRLDTYSPTPIPHYVVQFRSQSEMMKARNPLIKQGYLISELPQGTGKFFADKELNTSQWIEIDDDELIRFSMSHGYSRRKPLEFAVASNSIRSVNPTINGVPLNPPPVVMCCFDIETYSSRYGVDRSVAHSDHAIWSDVIYTISLTFHSSVDVNDAKRICIFLRPENLCKQESGELPKDIDAVHDSKAPLTSVTDEPFSIDGVEMIFVDSEHDLLIHFSELIRNEDPDVIYGYNITGFDFEYMFKRSNITPVETYGRLASFDNEIAGIPHKLDVNPVEQYHLRSWEGAGKSWHSFTLPECLGRIFLDTFNIVKVHKTDKSNPKALQSHKLADVGAFFVGHTKRDVRFLIDGKKYDSYAATYLGYRTGNVELLRVIADYCVQDTVVTMLVMARLKGWESARESAIIFCQDVNDVTFSGQTKKIKDRALRLAESMDYAYYPVERKISLKLEGGYVQNPVVGKHDNVACVDFSSMYPTTQMAFNICPSTYKKKLSKTDDPNDWIKVHIPIQLDRLDLPAEMEDYTGPDDTEFDIELIDNPDYMKDVFEHNKFNLEYMAEFIQTVKEEYGLAQPKMSYYEIYFLRNTKRRGVFPILLEEYRKARKEYKAIMTAATDPITKDIFNQKQNAVKVAMNSVYGVLSSARGFFSYVDLGAAITFLGRTAIKEVAAAFVADGCRVIYGDTDSVMIQSPGYVDKGLTAPVDMDSLAYFEKKTHWVNEVLLADRRPMEIELEKVMNAVFITKKRYCGETIWPKREPFFKGVSAVRGDMFPYGKLVYNKVFTMILEDKSKQEILEVGNEMINKLIDGDVHVDMITVSKMLAHVYALASAPMNVYAKYRRSIGEMAEPGTKIPYVVTRPAEWKRNLPKANYYRPPETTDPIDYEYYADYLVKHIQQLINAAFPEEAAE